MRGAAMRRFKHVTREAALTELVAFAPIESSQAFADAMAAATQTQREEASAHAITRAQEAGYDVTQNAETLMRIYESAAQREH